MAVSPNIVFVFADQLRARSVGFMGDRAVATPNLDRLAEGGVVFTNAVSCSPVCTPYRATLLTGRYPVSNGMVLNDVRLPEGEVCIAEVLREHRYRTGYVGKWHLDGPERGGFTPPGPRRAGFEYWAAANCTHDYMHSHYYRDDPRPIPIEGYDADCHTSLAMDFIAEHAGREPFCLFLSWAPPHDPYQLMPEEYRRYRAEDLELPPNCPTDTRADIAGYYSHIAALDRNFGRLSGLLDELGIADDTILVFTSDHGDMLGSHGCSNRKQVPWEESIHVPFALQYPRACEAGRRVPCVLNSVDLMPTLLQLAGVPVPATCEGTSLAHAVTGRPGESPQSAFLQHACTFADARRFSPWRGVRTERHTYVRNLEGPWLLYDNLEDPYQLRNLVGQPEHAGLESLLEAELRRWLERTGDEFLPQEAYWERFGYVVDEVNQAPYTWEIPW